MHKKLAAIVGACLVASALVAVSPGLASAQVIPTDRIATVTGPAVDGWGMAGNTLTALIGPRSCSITANTPFRSANQVKGHGEVTCSRAWDVLTLEVCVQAEQAAADDGGLTWQNAGCQPQKAGNNSSHLQDTATAACLPQATSYRTWVHAEGFTDDNPDQPAFAATLTSPEAVFNCGL
jgi:hypothetical protein